MTKVIYFAIAMAGMCAFPVTAQDTLHIAIHGPKLPAQPGSQNTFSISGDGRGGKNYYNTSALNGWTDCFGFTGADADGRAGVCTDIFTVSGTQNLLNAFNADISSRLASVRTEVLAAVKAPGDESNVGLRAQIDDLRTQVQALQQQVSDLQANRARGQVFTSTTRGRRSK